MKGKRLTDISEFERLKNFKRTVHVYQDQEFLDEIIIKEITPFESKVGGQFLSDIIIIGLDSNNLESRYVLGNCQFYYG